MSEGGGGSNTVLHSPVKKRLRGTRGGEQNGHHDGHQASAIPDYIKVEHLPEWLQKQIAEGAPDDTTLTPARVDELHHIQWYAWRDRKDYAAILQPAPLLLNAHFVGMNANNASITVGLITEALAKTGSPPLTVANTFLYGMYLLRNSRAPNSCLRWWQAHLSTPLHFCKGSLSQVMEMWALDALGPPGGETDARLLELCRTYPHSWLPNVLGKRIKVQVEELLLAEEWARAHSLLRPLFAEREWVTERGVWDGDLYWRLRLLAHLAKYRANGGASTGRCKVTVSALVFARSRGRLPLSLDKGKEEEEDGDEDGEEEGEEERDWVECGYELSPEQMSAMLSSLRRAFALFSSTYLALTCGAIEWVLDLDEQQDVRWNTSMRSRPARRERTGPTNPDRIIAQPDIHDCAEIRTLLGTGRVRESQALLVVWPGLKPPASYMCTCGGVAPRGPGDRFVFMSDGSMMDHEPLWSPEWWHHETFHILEHLFPETPFSKLSEEVGHPCFLRDRWPEGYSGLGECDFYYWSLRLHCLEARPTLAERLGRRPVDENVFTLNVGGGKMARVVNRLARDGDTIQLSGKGVMPLDLNDIRRGLRFQGEGVDSGHSLAVWRSGDLKLLVTSLPTGADVEGHVKLLRDAAPRDAQGVDATSASPPAWRKVVGPSPSFAVAQVTAWLEACVDKCLQDEFLCTYEGTGPYWMAQRWYKCKTCARDEVGVDGGVGLCSPCARACHEGHELVEQEYSPFYCDCPLGGFPSILCKKRRQPNVASNTTETALTS